MADRATARRMDSSSPASPPTGDAPFRTLLNEPQREAVTHGAGPLLVLAGAGSGKTRVITYRIAHLLAVHHVPPYRILAVTFTNKAAREMRQRIEALVGADIAADLRVGTFHATCARLLRRYHDAVGLDRDFVIYDDSDQRAVMNRVVKAEGLDDRQFPPKLLLSAIHGHKQHGHGPEDLSLNTPFDHVLAKAFGAYQRRLLAANAVDFDDLIIHITRLAEDPATVAGSELQRAFGHLLVDEFQDVNDVQYRLIRALSATHDNVCVVGDDDQSIYRWRGADVRIIRGFKHDYPNTRTVKLEQNYRSSANVVRAALGVIRLSAEREPKELFTENATGEPILVVATRNERDEAAWVVDQIRAALQQGVDPGDVAVFYRTHAQSRVLEEAMRAEGLPYQIVGGTRFFDRAEIKDMLAYLRVVSNPASDVDLLRIINVPARKIGQTTVERLVQSGNVRGCSVFDVLLGDLGATGLQSGARKRVKAFASMLQEIRGRAADLSPQALAKHVLEVTGYADALVRENTAEADARIQNLDELVGSIGEYEDEAVAAGETPSLPGYLERVSLVSNVDRMQDVARVSMMTVHAAKGLEFDLVIVTGAEEDLFPFRSRGGSTEPGQMEEERRLAYVAFTRARKQLVITYAGSRMIFGTTRYGTRSRFIDDLPEDVIEHRQSGTLQRMSTPDAGRYVFERRPAPSPPPVPRQRYVELDAAPAEVAGDAELTRGTRVVHPRFGEGRVEELHLSQRPPVALVQFPGWGTRKIAIGFLQPA